MDNELILVNRREIRHGWRYLMFNMVFMAPLMLILLTAIFPSIDGANFNFIYFVCNFLAVAVLFRKFWLKTLRASMQRIATCLLLALAGYALVRVAEVFLSMLIFSIDPNFFNINDQGIQDMARQNYWLIVIGSCILVPIAEEALYRGLVFGSLFRRSPVLAYVLSVSIFAFIHISEYVGYYPPTTLMLCFLQYLPAGLCLAAVYQLSGTLLTPILLHAFINIVGVLAMR